MRRGIKPPTQVVKITNHLARIYGCDPQKIDVIRYDNKDFDITFYDKKNAPILSVLPTMTVTRCNSYNNYCWAHENSSLLGSLLDPGFKNSAELNHIYKNIYCHFDSNCCFMTCKEPNIVQAATCLYDQMYTILDSNTSYIKLIKLMSQIQVE